jgi:hypothetical protein
MPCPLLPAALRAANACASHAARTATWLSAFHAIPVDELGAFLELLKAHLEDA